MPHVRWDRPAPEPCCHCFPLVLIVCTVASPGNPSGRHWLPDCESTAVDSRHAVPKESRRVRIVKGSRAGTCGECPELDAFESRGWRHVFPFCFCLCCGQILEEPFPHTPNLPEGAPATWFPKAEPVRLAGRGPRSRGDRGGSAGCDTAGSGVSTARLHLNAVIVPRSS